MNERGHELFGYILSLLSEADKNDLCELIDILLVAEQDEELDAAQVAILEILTDLP